MYRIRVEGILIPVIALLLVFIWREYYNDISNSFAAFTWKEALLRTFVSQETILLDFQRPGGERGFCFI